MKEGPKKGTYKKYVENNEKKNNIHAEQKHWPQLRAYVNGFNDAIPLGTKLGKREPFHIYFLSTSTFDTYRRDNDEKLPKREPSCTQDIMAFTHRYLIPQKGLFTKY